MGLLTPEKDRRFDPTHPFTFRFAGAESNVAVAAVRLELRVIWHSRLGADPLGDWILERLGREGVETGTVERDPHRNTGLMLKHRMPDGHTDVRYYRRDSAASAMEPGSFPLAHLLASRWLHVSGITPALSPSARATWLLAVRHAREQGIPVSLDPNIRLKLWSAGEAREFLLGALREGVDLLTPNQEEAALLFGDRPVEEQAAAALRAGARRVALKLGERGAFLGDRDGLVRVPPHSVGRAVDPVGAGDAFAGGLIAGMLRGLPFPDAGRLAAYCGAAAVTTVGDWEGAPAWADARRALNLPG